MSGCGAWSAAAPISKIRSTRTCRFPIFGCVADFAAPTASAGRSAIDTAARHENTGRLSRSASLNARGREAPARPDRRCVAPWPNIELRSRRRDRPGSERNMQQREAQRVPIPLVRDARQRLPCHLGISRRRDLSLAFRILMREATNCRRSFCPDTATSACCSDQPATR